MTFTIKNVPSRCLWGGVLFCTIYLSYRYPLQINFSGTSPTYRDTPFALQFGKFVVMLLVGMVSLSFSLKRAMTSRQLIYSVAIGLISIFPLVKLIYSPEAIYCDIAFWPLVALTLVLGIRSIDASDLDRYLKFLFGYALLSTFAEVFLFFAIGRLPALGYENSISVRFGGFLDDPNGFAALVFLLMGWSFYRHTGFTRVLCQASLLFCLLSTQSFTALGFLTVLSFGLMVWFLLRRPLHLFWLIPVVVALTPLALGYYEKVLAAPIRLLLLLKAPSIAQHSVSWGQWMSDWWRWVLTGTSPFTFYESWWASSLINFGVIWYAIDWLLILSLLGAVIKTFRKVSSRSDKAVLCGILIYSIYCIAGSVNLPLFTVFPLNVLFFTFTLLIAFGKVNWQSYSQ